MKILQLCHKPPYPANDGGTKAMHANTVALQKLGHEVHVLTIETAKHPVLWEDIDNEYIHKTDFSAFYKNTSPSKLDAFQAYILQENYHLDRFDIPEFHALIQRKLDDQQYDLVWLESLYVAVYIKTIRSSSPSTKILLRSHNVEYKLWENRLTEYSFPNNLFISSFNKKLKESEKIAFSQVDGIAAISNADSQEIKRFVTGKSVHTLPYFVSIPDQTDHVIKYNFGYIGALDWEPNIQGVTWLVKEVWPEVLKQLPSATLAVAGRNMDSRIQELHADGITILGEVSSSEKFTNSVDIIVIPLFAGSGIRIKLVESFAASKAVIATPIAVEGMAQGANEASAIGADVISFSQQMVSLASNYSLKVAYEQKAKIYFDRNYSESHYLSKLQSILKEVVK